MAVYRRAIGAALLILVGAGPAPVRALDIVKVSVYQSVSDAGIYIADAKGYFKAQNIGVDVVQLDAVPSVVTGLASGQIDVAGAAPSAAIYNSARQSIGIKIVADKGSMTKGHGYICLVVRKGLEEKIKTAADLQGHKVAWAGVGVGTTNEPALDRLLKQAGLSDSTIDVENLSFGDSLAALASGSVDAAYLIEPLAQAAVQRGIGTVLLKGDQIYPDQQVAVLLYAPDFIQKHADIARRFMVAYLQGVRDYDIAFQKGRDRPDIVNILAKETTVKKPELYDSMILPGLDPNGSVNVDGMKSDMEWFLSKGYLKAPVAVSKVIDDSFAKAAVAQLGLFSN